MRIEKLNDDITLYCGDCIKVMATMPDSELARAILVDELIRNAKLPGRLYLCNKRIPLKSIKSQLKLF